MATQRINLFLEVIELAKLRAFVVDEKSTARMMHVIDGNIYIHGGDILISTKTALELNFSVELSKFVDLITSYANQELVLDFQEENSLIAISTKTKRSKNTLDVSAIDLENLYFDPEDVKHENLKSLDGITDAKDLKDFQVRIKELKKLNSINKKSVEATAPNATGSGADEEDALNRGFHVIKDNEQYRLVASNASFVIGVTSLTASKAIALVENTGLSGKVAESIATYNEELVSMSYVADSNSLILIYKNGVAVRATTLKPVDQDSYASQIVQYLNGHAEEGDKSFNQEDTLVVDEKFKGVLNRLAISCGENDPSAHLKVDEAGNFNFNTSKSTEIVPSSLSLSDIDYEVNLKDLLPLVEVGDKLHFGPNLITVIKSPSFNSFNAVFPGVAQ